MKTEADGYSYGFESGKRVPREPDDCDASTAGNIGGPDFVRGFLRGVADGSKSKAGARG